MLARQRQQKILELLSREGGVKVSELSRRLDVSEMTVRRDMDALEARGLLARIHGGAVAVDIVAEQGFTEKRDLLLEQKQRIGRLAATLLETGMVAGLSAGTTTTEVARFLPRDSSISLVTNSITIAWELADSPLNIVLTGGDLRGASYALVGPLAMASLEGLWLDLLFLGVNGISVNGGLTTPNLAEAEINARLVERARRVVVVADHSKLGRTAFGRIAGLERADLLITSSEADPQQVQLLQNKGLKVQLA